MAFKKQGLYNPIYEHDNCGAGFICSLTGKKTNKIIFVDEDVEGGATAFMLDQVINKQKGYYHLDSEPLCITAKDHRPAYGSDGDYFSKPNREDIIEAIYGLMNEFDPISYPRIF